MARKARTVALTTLYTERKGRLSITTVKRHFSCCLAHSMPQCPLTSPKSLPSENRISLPPPTRPPPPPPPGPPPPPAPPLTVWCTHRRDATVSIILLASARALQSQHGLDDYTFRSCWHPLLFLRQLACVLGRTGTTFYLRTTRPLVAIGSRRNFEWVIVCAFICSLA